MGMTLAVLAVALGLGSAALVVTRPSARWITRNYRHPDRLRAAVAGAGGALAVFALPCVITPSRSEVCGPFAVVAAVGLLGCVALSPIWQRRAAVSLHPRRVLAIGAHPDDLELACGATLAKLVDNGGEVCTIVMSGGGSGGEARRRVEEARRGSTYLGAARTKVLDFCDTQLDIHENEMVKVLERAIREFRPDIVMTHSANDYHQDHSAVHRATMRAARREPTILCYESPSATPWFSPVFFVDISRHIDVKTHAIQVHEDQRKKPYMSPARTRGIAVFRGDQARAGLAEGFEVVRMGAASVGDL